MAHHTSAATWIAHVDKCMEAFNYLENRLENRCDPCYHCAAMYTILKLIRIFNPNVAAAGLITQADVGALAGVKPLANLNLVPELERELPKYLTAAAAAPAYDIGDIAAFSAGILTFFKTHSSTIPAWAHAARIVFAFLPNSAMSERVFALVKCMFGDEQLSTLSDCIQAALMLRDNGRSVG